MADVDRRRRVAQPATSARRCRSAAGTAFTITVRNEGGGPPPATTSAACRTTFPTYTFTRSAPVSPEVLRGGHRIRAGQEPLRDDLRQPRGADLVVPRSGAHGPRVLPNGNILWFDSHVQPLRDPPPRREPRPQPATPSASRPTPTTCSCSATATTWSAPTSRRDHVDTSAYGGLERRQRRQRRAAGGEPERPARSGTGRARTTSRWPKPARWWPVIEPPHPTGYDIVHWNSIEPARQLGDRLVQAPRRRLQDQQEHRHDRLEAGRHDRRPRA